MLRRAIGVLALVLAATLPAAAREACEGLGVEAYVATVPYFPSKMDRVQTQVPGGIAFAHPEDARINVTFRMQAVPPETPVTRMEYLKELRHRLDVEVARAPSGAEIRKGVFPVDPVAWTLQSRIQDGQDVAAAGSMTVRLAPTCHLVAVWNVREQPLLAGRIKEFANALDAVRAKATPAEDPGFLPDNNVPTGWRALMFGFAIPVMASLALMYGLKGMLLLRRPGPGPRVVAGLAAAACAAVGWLQLPDYVAGFEDGRLLDNAGILLLQVGLLAPAAMLGGQRATLSAFCVSACSGAALVLGSFLGWVPDHNVNLALGLVLLASSGGGLRLWWGAARRRRDKRPAPAIARIA